MAGKKCEECHKEYKVNGICNDCYKQCSIVVNELLSYGSNYIMKSTLAQLKLALLSFYNEESVSEAKGIILQPAKKMKINVSEAEQTRQHIGQPAGQPKQQRSMTS